MDARLGRMESDIADIRGRLQRLEIRSIRAGELDRDILRIDHGLDEVSQMLTKFEGEAGPVG